MAERDARKVAAAIDIGSNSIKMTVARITENGGIEEIDWVTTPVLLGQGLETTGRLDDGRIEAAIATLRQYAERAGKLGAVRIVAVATEATRAAENGAAFIGRVRAETGVDVRTIDGNEEAALTFRGLAATSDLSGMSLIADIGGGSTELIVAQDGTLLAARSLLLGSARLTDRYVQSDPPSAENLEACERDAHRVLDEAAGTLALPQIAAPRLIVLGGTGEYLARLVEPATEFDLAAIRTIQAQLLAVTAAELSARADIPEARARVLPAGSAIVAALAKRFKPEHVEIARSGIRAGMLLDLFYRPEANDVPSPESTLLALDEPQNAASAPDETVRFCDKIRSLIAARWRVVWKTIPAAIEGSDIEGVHDVRVASRRLRAAMDVGAVCFPRKWYRPLHQAAKEITSALGEVRDRDVLLASLRAELANAPAAEKPGIERLIARVEQERAVAREAMERFLDSVMSGPLQSEVDRRFGPHGQTVKTPVAKNGGQL